MRALSQSRASQIRTKRKMKQHPSSRGFLFGQATLNDTLAALKAQLEQISLNPRLTQSFGFLPCLSFSIW
jgi:hypothetical protein